VRSLVSVVIVAFHSRDALGPCLESLERNAAGVPVEPIVVDNASHDGTVEWLASAHPSVRVIENTNNAGFTRGVNQGLEVARGDALLVLNPDCEILPGAIERLLGALRSEPDIAAVAPSLVDHRGVVARSCGRFPDLWTLFADHFGLASAFPDSRVFGGYKYGGKSMPSMGRVGWASGAALMISRVAYERLGGLDEVLFMYMEEVDWCRRAAAAGLTVRHVPEARIVHVGQQSSCQQPGPSYLHNLRSRVYYFRKHHGPAAALAAKAILYTSLALKWVASRVSPARREASAISAAGIAAVRATSWR
jgi:N-acetylglucosaminyl-diphospho-decaprenol L-rhamnosyltransferase